MDNYFDDYPDFTEVVCWPESQNLMTKVGFRKHSALINSEHGIDMYGSSAYRVDPEWLEKVNNGEIGDYTEEEILAQDDEEMEIDCSFPFLDNEEEE